MRVSIQDFRDSLRKYKPTIHVEGQLTESVVDAPSGSLRPGVNALAVTYDFAHDAAKATLMTAAQSVSGKTVNRMLHINQSARDLLNTLEAVCRLCQETGCAQRYLAHDALNGIGQAMTRKGRLSLMPVPLGVRGKSPSMATRCSPASTANRQAW